MAEDKSGEVCEILRHEEKQLNFSDSSEEEEEDEEDSESEEDDTEIHQDQGGFDPGGLRSDLMSLTDLAQLPIPHLVRLLSQVGLTQDYSGLRKFRIFRPVQAK